MRDVDCAFLKAVPPTRANMMVCPVCDRRDGSHTSGCGRAISTAELVKLWQRSGVITHYPRVSQAVRVADLVGIVAAVSVIAGCLGYLIGVGAF